MDLELISLKLCPYVQRSVITLLLKQVPFRITHVDLNELPDWFLRISPFGKVPVLRVNGETAIFESAVIIEFIDETTPYPLHPRDPIRRAVNRSWIEFGSACLGDLYNVYTVSSEQDFQDKHAALRQRLSQIEAVLEEGPYFNGQVLALVDLAYAPFFLRLQLLHRARPLYAEAEFPKVSAWSEALLALPAVQNSVVPEFPALFWEHVRKKAPFAAGLFGQAG
jgi:glutathione S-transferase